MKKFQLYIAGLLALAAGYAQAQTYSPESAHWPAEPWRSATPVALGREVPRVQTICYDSEAAALGQSREASAYLQPLDESWKTTASGEATSYEHAFKVPFSWIDRNLYLYVGSANAPYEVFVNGERVGYNQSSWAAAEFDITGAAKEGMNSVEIKVHGNAAADILEDRPAEFTPRLNGETYIIAQPRVRVRDYVSRTTISGKDAMIELGVILKSNLLNPRTLTVHYSLLSPDGEVVTSGRRDREIDMRREDTVRFVVNVQDTKLWSPEDPNLYTLLIKTQHEGRYWEYIAYKVGIRTVEVDLTDVQAGAGNDTANKGTLLVNGKSFPFSFAENYTLSDYSFKAKTAAGTAISEMKSRNINTIMAYRPMPDWFYSLCDGMGMFVIPQADINTVKSGESRKAGGNPANDTTWVHSYIDRAEAIMYTSWHHPSVIGFSLGAGISNGYNLYESHLSIKHIQTESGDNRPVIYTNANGEWNTDAVLPQTASAYPLASAGRVVMEQANQFKPVTFELKDASKGLFSVSSSMYFRTVERLVSYTVWQGKSKVSRGTVDVKLMPDSNAQFTIPYGKAKPGKGPLRVELNIAMPSWDKNAGAKNTSDTIEVPFP